MDFQPRHPYRWRLLLGGGFALLDILFFSVLWLIGQGYIMLGPIDPPPTLQEIEARSAIWRVWTVLHAPVDKIFGPYLFPHFRAHGGGLPDMLSYLIYVVLCFGQMFVVGFLIGILLEKLTSTLRKQP
jgi:hypothetical protein